MFKPSSVIQIPTTLDKFFESWLICLRPWNGLTDRQIKLAAAFLKVRYELSKVISDDKILDETLFNSSSRDRIIKDCNIRPDHFRVLMGELRKNRFFIDKSINKRYIPNLSLTNPEDCSLVLLFNIENESSGETI